MLTINPVVTYTYNKITRKVRYEYINKSVRSLTFATNSLSTIKRSMQHMLLLLFKNNTIILQDKMKKQLIQLLNSIHGMDRRKTLIIHMLWLLTEALLLLEQYY